MTKTVDYCLSVCYNTVDENFIKTVKNMTDQQYYGAFSKLCETLAERGELDSELFREIYEGKIKAIVRNTFSEAAGYFNSVDLEDMYQDLFIKLWTRCVSAYFTNGKYEISAPMFLGWCKVVIKNHVTSMIRKKSLRAVETLDDPDHPITVTDGSDPSSGIIGGDAVSAVFKAALGVSARPEMKLTWFGVYAPVYDGEADGRIAATHLYFERWADKTYRDVRRGVEESDGVRRVFGDDTADRFAPLDTDSSVTVAEDLGDDPLGKISDRLYKMNKKLANALPSEVVEWNT